MVFIKKDRAVGTPGITRTHPHRRDRWWTLGDSGCRGRTDTGWQTAVTSVEREDTRDGPNVHSGTKAGAVTVRDSHDSV